MNATSPPAFFAPSTAVRKTRLLYECSRRLPATANIFGVYDTEQSLLSKFVIIKFATISGKNEIDDKSGFFRKVFNLFRLFDFL
jgi:hypothetical protein